MCIMKTERLIQQLNSGNLLNFELDVKFYIFLTLAIKEQKRLLLIPNRYKTAYLISCLIFILYLDFQFVTDT